MKADRSLLRDAESYAQLILDVLARVRGVAGDSALVSLLFLACEQYARFAVQECSTEGERAVFSRAAHILGACAQHGVASPDVLTKLEEAFVAVKNAQSASSESAVDSHVATDVAAASHPSLSQALETLTSVTEESSNRSRGVASSSLLQRESDGEPQSHGLKILVVEDDLVSRLALSRIVSTVGTVDIAPDGHEGFIAYLIAAAQGVPYDVIFLDVLLPKLHGMRLLKHIRSLEEERGITLSGSVPIVMATGASDPATTLGSFREGCEAYLVKPIHRKEVFKVLNKLSLVAPAQEEISQ